MRMAKGFDMVSDRPFNILLALLGFEILIDIPISSFEQVTIDKVLVVFRLKLGRYVVIYIRIL